MKNKSTFLFADRKQAGRKLVKYLKKFVDKKPIILALPRGGIPVGYEISKVLNFPLDILVTRKIGSPSQPEFGVGAISEGRVEVIDWYSLTLANLSEIDLKQLLSEQRLELNRRIRMYRNNRPLPDLKNRTVILVDDGLATGVTAKAAISAVKKHHPKSIIFASPICSYDTAQEIATLTDDVICLAYPFNIGSIGVWYKNFDQVTDDEVVELLRQARIKQPQKYQTLASHNTKFLSG